MSIVTVIGIDLGDKFHCFCVLDAEGCVAEEGRIRATVDSVRRFLGGLERSRVVIEAGTHSPWVSRVAFECGHEVFVGNPRKLRMIFNEEYKSDKRDAEMLARVGRLDPKLLSPIRHRSARAQGHLALIKSRDALVRSRSSLVCHARGLVKSFGYRLPSCSASSFHRRAAAALPVELRPALAPLLLVIGRLSELIRCYDRQVEELCAREYPETAVLRQVKGVGPLTAPAYVLTLESAARFCSCRAVGAYLGLVPRRDQSGSVDKQLPISKAGNGYLRRLLVSCAHYILGPWGGESALRSWGLRLIGRGGRAARKRAVVAVARKLSVVLCRLWRDGAEYRPFTGGEVEAA